jgi:hypothetical protein
VVDYNKLARAEYSLREGALSPLQAEPTNDSDEGVYN